MDQWDYKPAPDLEASIANALRDFPRQPDMLIYGVRSVAATLLRGWLRLYHRMQVDGREHLPNSGSFILVCNHTSHLDTLCMLSAVPLRSIHRTFPAAAADYFFTSLKRTLVSAILINALPFERKTAGAQSLAVCSELLKNDGNVLILFPEGTRTTTGEMGRFRSGIGRIVAGTRANCICASARRVISVTWTHHASRYKPSVRSCKHASPRLARHHHDHLRPQTEIPESAATAVSPAGRRRCYR